ncbi:MAG: ABC transporter permease [Terriglobales bacterium]
MALGRDIGYALRRMRQAPGFTAVAVAVLALGIGANTAIFSIINAALLRPLPYRQPQQLVALYETLRSPGNFSISEPDFLDWQRQSSLFEGMSMYQYPRDFNLSGAGEPLRVRGAQAEANFFSVLGVKAALGRTFAPGEDTAGTSDVVILNYDFWRSEFGGDANVVGKGMVLDGRTYRVAGVLPASFHWQPQFQVWVPLALNPAALEARGYHGMSAVARLRPGVTPAAAEAQLSAIAAHLARLYPVSNRGVGVNVEPLRDSFVAAPLRASLWMLLAVVGLVLLIACADLANMLLARASGRRQEIAIRRALGASGRQIAVQVLVEALVLAVAGAIAGTFLAWAGLRAGSGLAALQLPATAVVGLDVRVLVFTALIAVAAGILFGLAPVWQLRPSRLQSELIRGASPRRGRLGDALIAGEVALALVLVVVSGLLLASLQRMRTRPLGVNPDHLVTMEVSVGPASTANFYAGQTLQNEFVRRLTALPGIAGASLANLLPMEGAGFANGYPVLEGHSEPSHVLIEDARVSADYLQTTQLPLLTGSWYRPAQVQAWQQAALWKWASPPSPQRKAALAPLDLSVVVNEAFARQFFPDGALGKRFRDDQYSPWMTIQGVVGNMPITGPRQVAPMPEAYYPVFSGPYLLVRAPLPAAAVAADVRRVQAGLGLSTPVYNLRTMEQVVDGASSSEALQGGLVSAFAALALLLAAAGIYGVMALLVAGRKQEIGVRMALGAGRGAITALVLRRALGLTLAGVVLGTAAALLAGRAMAAQLYQTKPGDPRLLALAAVVLFLAALLASYLPARRAARVDPLQVLREL